MNLAANIPITGPELPAANQVQQLDLFVMGPSVYKSFLQFNQKYPQVYLLFEKFAMQLIRAGKTKLGSKMILERIRWEIVTGSKDDEGFKINNNFTAYYSRWFIRNHPEYAEYFEFRTIRRM